MSRFLITGANGFVGKALTSRLLQEGHHVIALVREDAGAGSAVSAKAAFKAAQTSALEWVATETDFTGLTAQVERWSSERRVDCVVHLAARVHVMQESALHALQRYRETNVAGALRVAEAAHRAGAKRFVFMSSIKAMGDREPGHPWSEQDTPMPDDPYGQTKLEAERALQAFCTREGMAFVAIRPPLVYGPHVRANFLQLMSVVSRRIPLPLGAVDAQRSMIYIANLVDAIMHCAAHPQAADQVFNVSDGDDRSVAQIVRVLGNAMARPARLLTVPPNCLHGLARIAGKSEQAGRLLNPLRLDMSHIAAQTGWHPKISLEDGLRDTAIWYRQAFLANR